MQSEVYSVALRIIFAALCFLLASEMSLQAMEPVIVSTSEELETLFSERVDSVVVQLRHGTYTLSPTFQVESTCGNCADPDHDVFISVGIRIGGEKVVISGPPDGSATIVTGAGYGVYFEDCRDCSIQNVAITGGTRDSDPNATDAAVVARNSAVTISNCLIHDNTGDPPVVESTVVGIMGICGRANSRLIISGNRIIRNSWDGIALYRDAEATISGNVIDGVDKARGKDIGGGRGVGIGVTWNAKALIIENLVRRYWKGIGIFVDAEATLHRNIVEDILTWGIAVWDAGKGAPTARIDGNIIYNTGACGVSINRSKPGEDPGHFRTNVVVATGRDVRYDSPDRYCYQCALAAHAVPENFPIVANIFFNNRRATDDLPDHDISKIAFRRAIDPICMDLAEFEMFGESEFCGKFCDDESSDLYRHSLGDAAGKKKK